MTVDRSALTAEAREADIWTCKVGTREPTDRPKGSDGPMREAVARRFERVTGVEAEFIFSGWSGTLTEGEWAVVEDRPPDPNAMGDSDLIRGARLMADECTGEIAHLLRRLADALEARLA